tara:strand:- start:764 stop:1159 length:396 start_codon:yes stop_codon:yes gene_type:complete
MKGPRHLLKSQRGAAAIEFALIGLPFIILLLGLIEFGRGLYIRNALDSAADRAQRVIMINPSATTAILDQTILSAFQVGPSGSLTLNYAVETIAGVNYRRVSLEYAMQLLLPAPLGRTVNIVSSRRVVLPS